MTPTLTLEQASRRCWDVLIAGAGPAGAVTAYRLAVRGLSVLLLDKATFPRWKVCGCCLNGATLDALQALGLGDVCRRAGAPRLRRMRLAVGSGAATLPLRTGVALSREALDVALIQAAIEAGAAFLSGTEAVLLPGTGTLRSVRLRCGGIESTTTAKLAVAADGLGGTFLRRVEGMEPRVAASSPIGAGAVFADAPEFYEPGTIYMACGRGAYVGAVRLEDGRLDMAAAIERTRLRDSPGIGPLLRETLEESRFPVPRGLAEADWRGTPPLTRSRSRVAGHRLFVVGDSAGYVEPFTGEGISWAVQAAGFLVPHVLRALEGWDSNLATGWETRYRRFFEKRSKVCLLAGRLLRYRPAARAAVALLGQAPWLAAPWMKQVSILDPEWKWIAGGGAS